ncbi:MAG: SPOR domain-containing protein [Prevotellaceae bacterium]|nr:SPOR domain-containing protein [Prevotellaceae bacterium]
MPPASVPPVSVPPITPLYSSRPGPDTENKPKRRTRCIVFWILLALVLLAAGIFILRSILAFYEREEAALHSLRQTRQTTAPTVQKETPPPAAVQTPAETPAETPVPEEPVAAPVKKKTADKTQKANSRRPNAMNLYHIMVGAYANEQEAKAAMQRLQEEAGCSCLLVNTGGQLPYKISSFRYATQREANEILSVLKRTDPEYGSAWVERY